MQATIISLQTVPGKTASPAASNNVEPSAAVSGIRISSGPQSSARNALFTAILHQGITLGMPQGQSEGDAASLTGNPEDQNKKGAGDPVDVCSLLMQLMVMNASPQPAGDAGQGTEAEAEGKTLQGVLGVIAAQPELADPAVTAGMALQGTENAAAAILQNDTSNAGQVLTQMADAGTPGLKQGNGMQNGATGIVETIKNTIAAEAAAAQATAGGEQTTQQSGAADDKGQGFQLGTALSELRNAGENNGKDGAKDTAVDGVKAGNSNAAADKAPIGVKQADGGNTGTAGNDNGKSESGLGLNGREKSKMETPAATGTFVSAGSTARSTAGGTIWQGETSAEKTAAVEKALNRFTDDLRGIQGGSQEIKIVLEPESMGVLTISVTKTETGVSAKIKSEDKEIVAAISDHLQKLIASMKNKGIKVGDVDVVYSQAERNTGFGFGQQHSFARGGDGSPRGYSPPAPDKNQEGDAPGAEVFQGYYGDDQSGDSTVEYRI